MWSNSKMFYLILNLIAYCLHKGPTVSSKGFRGRDKDGGWGGEAGLSVSRYSWLISQNTSLVQLSVARLDATSVIAPTLAWLPSFRAPYNLIQSAKYFCFDHEDNFDIFTIKYGKIINWGIDPNILFHQTWIDFEDQISNFHGPTIAFPKFLHVKEKFPLDCQVSARIYFPDPSSWPPQGVNGEGWIFRIYGDRV